MRPTSLLAALSAAGTISAGVPRSIRRAPRNSTDGVNPFVGKTLFVNPAYAAKLDLTYAAFTAKGDEANAVRIRKV